MLINPFSKGFISEDRPSVALAEPTVEENTMSARFLISTQDEDRTGDVIMTAGIDTAAHRLNPLVLFNHQRLLPPVGISESRERLYTVELLGQEGKAFGTVFFNDATPLSWQVFQLVLKRHLRGASVGFLPKQVKARGRYNDAIKRPPVNVERCELVEYSVVTIPDNPYTVRQLMIDGVNGKPICDELCKAWEPHAGRKPPTVTACVEFKDGEIVSEEVAAESCIGVWCRPEAFASQSEAEAYCDSKGLKSIGAEPDARGGWFIKLREHEGMSEILATDIDDKIQGHFEVKRLPSEPAPIVEPIAIPPIEQPAEPVVDKMADADPKAWFKRSRSAVSDCCDFLDEHAEQSNLTRTQRAAVRSHCEALRRCLEAKDGDDDEAVVTGTIQKKDIDDVRSVADDSGQPSPAFVEVTARNGEQLKILMQPAIAPADEVRLRSVESGFAELNKLLRRAVGKR